MNIIKLRSELPGPFTPTREQLTELSVALYDAAEFAQDHNHPNTARSYLALRELVRVAREQDPIEQEFRKEALGR